MGQAKQRRLRYSEAKKIFASVVSRLTTQNHDNNFEIVSNSDLYFPEPGKGPSARLQLSVFVRELCPAGGVVQILHLAYAMEDGNLVNIHSCTRHDSRLRGTLRCGAWWKPHSCDSGWEFYHLHGSVSPKIEDGKMIPIIA